MNTYNSRLTVLHTLFAGLFIGLFTVFTPFLTNKLAKLSHITLDGTNILKLFPYELVILLFICLAGVFTVAVAIRKIPFPTEHRIEQASVLLIIAGLNFVAITEYALIDLSETGLLLYITYLFIATVIRKKRFVISFLDLLNLLFTSAALFACTVAGMMYFLVYTPALVKFSLIIFVLLNILRKRVMFIFALKCFLFFTFISAIIAIFQEIIFLTTDIVPLGNIPPKSFKFLLEQTSYAMFLRTPAFFNSYKPFTIFLNSSILFLINYSLFNRPLGMKKTILIAGAVIVMTVALIFTFSKDAGLALGVGLVLSLIMWRPYLLIHLLIAGILLVGILGFMGIAEDIFDSLAYDVRAGETRIRVQFIREGLEGYVHKHPLVGVGVAYTHRYIGHYHHWCVHNTFLEVADATGSVGLFFYLVLIIYTFYILIVGILYARDLRDKWISRGLLTGFLALAITLQFHPLFYERIMWLYMGIINAYIIMRRTEKFRQYPETA